MRRPRPHPVPGRAAALLFAAAVSAQGYPSKPIKIVVPFTPGSATDIMARIVGEKLQATWGQTVVVENRPGAGGTVGSAQVAKSEPDGHTLLVVSTGHVVNPMLYPGLSYDTVADFAGITPLAMLPNLLVVPANSPFKNVGDLIAAAKARPGQLNYASAGHGSATHVNTEKFRAATGLTLTPIPFKGTPETLTEIGVPGFKFDFWFGLLAPAKTPRDVVAKLHQEVSRSLAAPDVKERMAKLGAEPMPVTPEQFDAFVKEEHVTLGVVMKDVAK